MSKLSVQVGAKDFDIKVDKDFFAFFEKDFKKIFKDKRNIDIKELLSAYVQKTYNEYKNNIEIKEIIEKVDNV